MVPAGGARDNTVAMSDRVHTYGDGVKLAIMAVLIVAFLLALPLMFVHPGMVFILFWLGLITLAAAMVIGWLIGATRHATARHALKHCECPHCRCKICEDPSGEWHCVECGYGYLASGAETA